MIWVDNPVDQQDVFEQALAVTSDNRETAFKKSPKTVPYISEVDEDDVLYLAGRQINVLGNVGKGSALIIRAEPRALIVIQGSIEEEAHVVVIGDGDVKMSIYDNVEDDAVVICLGSDQSQVEIGGEISSKASIVSTSCDSSILAYTEKVGSGTILSCNNLYLHSYGSTDV